MTRDATEMAQACADAMWADDKASRTMGMQIEKVGPGFCVLSMNIRVDMVNGHGLCHGGYIFSLADSALAFACNSHNQRHGAQQCQIAYLAPLLAEARERYRGERRHLRCDGAYGGGRNHRRVPWPQPVHPG